MDISTLLGNAGLYIAVIGASLSVALACAGSGKGVGIVGETAAGVLAEDPSRFASCLILEIIPGTQGIYGLVIWFYAIFSLGIMGSNPVTLTVPEGIGFCFACIPMAIGGYFTAIAQGRCAAAGLSLTAKRPDQMSKAIIMAIMVEFYAILCLLASFMMLLFL